VDNIRVIQRSYLGTFAFIGIFVSGVMAGYKIIKVCCVSSSFFAVTNSKKQCMKILNG